MGNLSSSFPSGKTAFFATRGRKFSTLARIRSRSYRPSYLASLLGYRTEAFANRPATSTSRSNSEPPKALGDPFAQRHGRVLQSQKGRSQRGQILGPPRHHLPGIRSQIPNRVSGRLPGARQPRCRIVPENIGRFVDTFLVVDDQALRLQMVDGQPGPTRRTSHKIQPDQTA